MPGITVAADDDAPPGSADGFSRIPLGGGGGGCRSEGWGGVN